MSKGQSLLEVLLAIGIFITGIATVGLLVLDANVASRQGGERTEAVLLAKEGLEAARSIRDGDFDNVTAGAHGIALSANTWIFSGVSDTQNQFTRTITVSDIDVDTKKVESTVSWQFTQTRQNSVTFVDYLTDWNQTHGNAGENFLVGLLNALVQNKELQDVTIQNIGPVARTIDKITLFWTNTANKIEEITIDGTKVWSKSGPGTPSGEQVSGTEINIQDFTIPANSGVLEIDKFKFDNDMTDNNFLVKFTMHGDVSTKYSLMDFSGGDAVNLSIDLSSAYISGKELRDVKLRNNGSVFLALDKIIPVWSISGSERKITEITIGGTKVWSKSGPGTPSGEQVSGTELNIQNYQILPGATKTIDKFKFEGSNMSGATFNITFILGNGSSKSTGNFTP
jgi:Tfp pilus assembly protein PilV